jgi:hypothetical protein
VALLAYHLFRYVGDSEDSPVDVVTPTEALREADPPPAEEPGDDAPRNS